MYCPIFENMNKIKILSLLLLPKTLSQVNAMQLENTFIKGANSVAEDVKLCSMFTEGYRGECTGREALCRGGWERVPTLPEMA